MDVQDDYRELLELFNAREVEYLVVGGYALAFHGAPRFTGDLDLYVRPQRENAERVIQALEDFGFGSLDVTTDDLAAPDRVIQLGVAPVRVDLVTSISGVSWAEAWAGKAQGVPVRFLGRKQFVANKKASGRRRDLADLEALGEET